MDLDDVRVFTKVVTAGSFTQAAKLLGLPKSTVSRRVSHLECVLGVQLIHRTTRRLQLTPAGAEYFRRTSRAIGELEDAGRQVEGLQAQARGLLRLTIPGDLAGVVPELLREFQQEHPLVDLVVFSTGRRVDLVGEGYDLALRAGFLEDSSLIARKLLVSKLRLFASPEYLKVHGEPMHPDELVHHECLIFSDEQTETAWKLRGPDGWCEVSVRGRIATRDFNLQRSLVAQGQGIGFLPRLAAEGQCKSGGLIRILPAYESEESGLFAVYPAGRHLAARVRVFVDFAAAWLSARFPEFSS